MCVWRRWIGTRSLGSLRRIIMNWYENEKNYQFQSTFSIHRPFHGKRRGNKGTSEDKNNTGHPTTERWRNEFCKTFSVRGNAIAHHLTTSNLCSKLKFISICCRCICAFSLSHSFRFLAFSFSLLISGIGRTMLVACERNYQDVLLSAFEMNLLSGWRPFMRSRPHKRHRRRSLTVQIFEFISTRRLQWNAGTRWLSSMSNHLYLRTHHVWWTKPSQAKPSKNAYALVSLN